MQPKVLRTDIAEYRPAAFDGVNKSGIEPIGEKVLVLIDTVSEKTSGGVWIPEDQRHRQSLAAETGVIAALGDDAFTWNADRTRPWQGYRPLVGDHVYIERYSGAVFPGDDKQTYRIVDDKCIGAIRQRPIGNTEE